MTDANLVRVLSRQAEGGVGLVPFDTVEQGAAAIRQAMTRLTKRAGAGRSSMPSRTSTCWRSARRSPRMRW